MKNYLKHMNVSSWLLAALGVWNIVSGAAYLPDWLGWVQLGAGVGILGLVAFMLRFARKHELFLLEVIESSEATIAECKEFLDSGEDPFMQVVYEDLLARAEETLAIAQSRVKESS